MTSVPTINQTNRYILYLLNTEDFNYTIKTLSLRMYVCVCMYVCMCICERMLYRRQDVQLFTISSSYFFQMIMYVCAEIRSMW